MKQFLNYFICKRKDLLVIIWSISGAGLFFSYLYFDLDDYYALIMAFVYFVITMNFKTWREIYCLSLDNKK